VYQLTRGITSPGDIQILPKPGLQAPSDVQDSPAVRASKRRFDLLPWMEDRLFLRNLKPRDVMIEIVRPVDNPDLIWDPNSHDVIAWGDVVAYNVDSSDLASVIDRTAAVRELKKISTKVPQLLRLTAGDEQHHNDDMVQVELSDVAQALNRSGECIRRWDDSIAVSTWNRPKYCFKFPDFATRSRTIWGRSGYRGNFYGSAS